MSLHDLFLFIGLVTIGSVIGIIIVVLYIIKDCINKIKKFLGF